jgi:hypothetical protein
MGYGDWTQITIHNQSDVTITINNAQLQWGKFYRSREASFLVLIAPSANSLYSADKDAALEPHRVNGIEIKPNESYTLGSCGRENTWSGCQGDFELQEPNGTICKVYFYSPHGTSYNQFRLDATQPRRWAVSQSGGYFGNDGPLGSVNIFAKKF